MSDHRTTLTLAAGLGAIAGMRSMAAPALLSHHFAHGKGRGGGRVARLLASRPAAAGLKLLATGEMAADKTPWIPPRTDLPALVGRVLAGALAGAAVASRRGGSPLGAVLAGSATAAGATFAAYHLRREVGRRTGLPDTVLGVIEDTLVLTAGERLAAAV